MVILFVQRRFNHVGLVSPRSTFPYLCVLRTKDTHWIPSEPRCHYHTAQRTTVYAMDGIAAWYIHTAHTEQRWHTTNHRLVMAHMQHLLKSYPRRWKHDDVLRLVTAIDDGSFISSSIITIDDDESMARTIPANHD